MLKAIKVRLYPTIEQQQALSKSFGCARWYWNYSLNQCIQHYEKTGKSLKLNVYKGMLPNLKVEHPWLKDDCYSSVLQCVAINLNKAYSNFFVRVASPPGEGRAKFPRFKSKKDKQSIQYPQNVTVAGKFLKIPKVGEVEAVFHRPIEGTIKTVTISKTPSDKYFASVLCEVEGTEELKLSDKIVGIDLGLKDFAIVHDGEKVEKFSNPKHLKRHEKNLARKQKKHARKQKGSKSKEKSRKLIALVHERVANTRQDFLHKLSRRLVDESQVITVENLNVKGMKRNRKLSKSISDVGWGMFVNFLDYKLQKRNGRLIDVNRFFPSSKMCSCCNHVVDKLTLDIREWDCPQCLTHHDRDGNAALNIRNEGIRIMNSPACQDVTAGGKDRYCWWRLCKTE